MRIEELTPANVMAAASKATGLDDYGERDFVEGLTIYLDDVRRVGELSELGTDYLFQDIVRLLSNRLGFQRDLKRHPEILDERIEKPIIITGLPRTGTTKLQRMISADPGVQRLEAWRVNFPAPLPDSEGFAPDPRIAIMEQIEEMMKMQMPEMFARHPVEAREPDEEWYLLEMTFESSFSSIRTNAPNHRAWIERRSARNSYIYLRKLLQYLQWQDGGGTGKNQGRPWILKTPAHLGQLPTLLEVFPDATLVQCHRHPGLALPSALSLLEYGHGIYCAHVDFHALGSDYLTDFQRQIERNLAGRKEIGESRILDVYYEDIRERPESVIADIYARAGRALTPEASRAFATWAKSRPEGRFGKYQNQMERYGLTREKIDVAFAEYLRRFPRVSA